MRTALLALIGCLTIALSGVALADEDGGCGGGNCEAGACNPYESNCQCTDPLCSKPSYTDCISRGYCCEAFGNIGAR